MEGLGTLSLWLVRKVLYCTEDCRQTGKFLVCFSFHLCATTCLKKNCFIDALGDCWIYNMGSNTWTEMQLPSQDKRLWHQSVFVDKSLFVIGGVKKNILHSNPQEPIVG